jgi:phage-related minor tail protein
VSTQKGSPTKEDLKNFKEEIVIQFHVISEGVIDQAKQVAEGVANVNEKLDRRFNELKAEIDNKTQPIAQAVLELSGKVVALDGKVDRIHQELKTEIQK